ncbi:MAG: hypothetical protein ACRDTS_09905 [Mycobacterium sp.]
MPINPVPAVTLTPVAYFPEKYFLENLTVRSDGSILITAVLQKELWCVPGPEPRTDVAPVLVHTFEHPVSGILEVEPDVFIVCLTDAYTTHESHLARIDFTDWTPGEPVSPDIIFTFDDRVRGLNGSCLLGPGVMLVADCFAGFIWRIDLGQDARSAIARIWLAHDTMAMDPAGNAEFAYVTRHRANTVDRVPLEPRQGSEVRHIAGDPLDKALIGPSSAAWSRSPGDHGRVAYVTTDGGITAPPDGVVRKAALLRLELQPHVT